MRLIATIPAINIGDLGTVQIGQMKQEDIQALVKKMPALTIYFVEVPDAPKSEKKTEEKKQ